MLIKSGCYVLGKEPWITEIHRVFGLVLFISAIAFKISVIRDSSQKIVGKEGGPSMKSTVISILIDLAHILG